MEIDQDTDYEYNTSDVEQGGSPSKFVLYEQFLRRELPSRVRQELEIRIEEALSPVEEGLQSQLVDIVRDTQRQLFEIYESSRSMTRPASASDANLQDGPHGAQLTAPQITTHEQHYPGNMMTNSLDLGDTLQAYQPIPPYLEDFDVFQGEMFDFSAIQPSLLGCDSGYGGSLVSEQGKGH